MSLRHNDNFSHDNFEMALMANHAHVWWYNRAPLTPLSWVHLLTIAGGQTCSEDVDDGVNDLRVGEQGALLVLSPLLTLGDQGVRDVSGVVLASQNRALSAHTHIHTQTTK